MKPDRPVPPAAPGEAARPPAAGCIPPPSLFISTAVIVLVAVVWCYLRLVVFPGTRVPLTYVLPLLLCVWTRRAWQLWALTAVFCVLAFAKTFWFLPLADWTGLERQALFWSTEANILIGAYVTRVMMRYRADIEERNRVIGLQNEELGGQTVELVRQNEEIRLQSEELQVLNDRLVSREGVLEGLLQSSHQPEKAAEALGETCRHALRILGAPAETIAIFELAGGTLVRRVEATVPGGPTLPATWPLAGSLPQEAMRRGETLDLAQPGPGPAGTPEALCSLLAAPLCLDGESTGVLVAGGRRAAAWTPEQFRMLAWISDHCALIMSGLRWQQKLSERAQEVEAANVAKDHFLAMLSHELRTPLTPVLAAAGALANDDRLPADVRETLAMIRRNINIQGRLIDDLLDVTRIERGKLDLSLEILNVEKLLREAAAIVAAELDAREQTLVLRLQLPPGCALRGDSARLQQVLWNLLRNASKFSPARAEIVLEAQASAGPSPRLTLAVADPGIGIDAADLERIFLPFEQVGSGARRSSGAGLGLGLSIAKAIVLLHQGTVQAASAGPGQGSRFTLELPLSAIVLPASDAATAPFHPSARAGRGWRILLVEDHVDTGRIIMWLLTANGNQVELATTAAMALDLAATCPFDLVISDLGLPDESGIVLMQKLRVLKPGLRGLCMSGYGTEEDLLACRDAGFDEHLTKPVDLQQLYLAIGRVMGRGPQPSTAPFAAAAAS